MGVTITDGASNVVVDFNTFRHIGYYTWDIEPNGAHRRRPARRWRHVQFSDNVIGTKPYGDYPTDADPGGRVRVRGHQCLGRRPRRRHRALPQPHDRHDDRCVQDRRVRQRDPPEHPRHRQHGGGQARRRPGDVVLGGQRPDRDRQHPAAELGLAREQLGLHVGDRERATSRTDDTAPIERRTDGLPPTGGGPSSVSRVPSGHARGADTGPASRRRNRWGPSSGSRPSPRSRSASPGQILFKPAAAVGRRRRPAPARPSRPAAGVRASASPAPPACTRTATVATRPGGERRHGGPPGLRRREPQGSVVCLAAATATTGSRASSTSRPRGRAHDRRTRRPTVRDRPQRETRASASTTAASDIHILDLTIEGYWPEAGHRRRGDPRRSRATTGSRSAAPTTSRSGRT